MLRTELLKYISELEKEIQLIKEQMDFNKRQYQEIVLDMEKEIESLRHEQNN